jgi:hypothetical protein
MPRGPANFKERDVTAAIRAARKAGETGQVRIEIGKNGKTIVIISRENAEPAPAEANEWDED